MKVKVVCCCIHVLYFIIRCHSCYLFCRYIFCCLFSMATIRGWHLKLADSNDSWIRYMQAIQLSLIDAGSSVHSLSVLLLAMETSLRAWTAPQLMQGEGVWCQVQILGLAPEAWSDQWNRRVATIWIMGKRLQSYTQSDIMKFIIHTDQFVTYTNNHKVSVLARDYGLVTPDPFSSCELGGV